MDFESNARGIGVLVEFIDRVLNESKKRYALIVSPSSTDLGLAINWLRLNRYISLASDIEERNGRYVVRVKRRVDHDAIVSSINAKFGRFVDVVKP